MRRLAAVLLTGALACSACSTDRPPQAGSVLKPGTALPPGLTSLQASERDGRVRIAGAFARDGRTVRFVTQRIDRMPLHEVLAGANRWQIDGCFVDERGRLLIGFAGGHAVTLPECRSSNELEHADERDENDADGMATAVAAMETLEALPFRDEYQSEKAALVGTLDFTRSIRGRTDDVLAVTPE